MDGSDLDGHSVALNCQEQSAVDTQSSEHEEHHPAVNVSFRLSIDDGSIVVDDGISDNRKGDMSRYTLLPLRCVFRIVPLLACMWCVIFLPLSAHQFLEDKVSNTTVSWKPQNAFDVKAFERRWPYVGCLGILPFNTSLGWQLAAMTCRSTVFPALSLGILTSVCWLAGDLLFGLGGGFVGWAVALSIWLALMLFGTAGFCAKRPKLLLVTVLWYASLQLSMSCYTFFLDEIFAGSKGQGFLPPLIAALYQFISVRLAHYIFCWSGDSAPVETKILPVVMCGQIAKIARMMGFLSLSLYRGDIRNIRTTILQMSVTSVLIELLRRLRIPHAILAVCLRGHHRVRFVSQVAIRGSISLTYLPITMILVVTPVYVLFGEPAVLCWRFYIFLSLFMILEVITDIVYLMCQRSLWHGNGEQHETWSDTLKRVNQPLGIRFPRSICDAHWDPLPKQGEPLQGFGSFSAETMSAVYLTCVSFMAAQTMLVGSVVDPANFPYRWIMARQW